MKARPILFSGPMILALLEGRKTQTRRVVKQSRGRPIEFLGGGPKGGPDWNDPSYWGYEHHDSGTWVLLRQDKESDTAQYPCPYGTAGDVLWARETITTRDRHPDGFRYEPFYRADVTDSHGLCFATDDGPRYVEQLRWTPGIHMPRTASRLTLRLTDVRAQRLQDISEADAIAEGVQRDSDGWIDYQTPWTQCCTSAVASYKTLWESINGAGSWDANPYVWALSFSVIKQNVDAYLASQGASSDR